MAELNMSELSKVNGGAAQNPNTIPVEAVNTFIRTCKNSWGLDLEGALANLETNWASYSASWAKGGVTPDLAACKTFVRAHWDKVF